jgi:ribosomal 30S subunit maturation factor RimM
MRITSNHVLPVALALFCSAVGAQETELKSGEVRASHLLGATVKRLTGDSVGEVEDLIVSADADVRLAVVSVGGVLGVGGKTVALPFHEFMVAPDGGTLFLTMSEEQLAAWPAFDLESVRTDSHSAADEPVSPLGETTFEANDFASTADNSNHGDVTPGEPHLEQPAAAAQQPDEEEQFAQTEQRVLNEQTPEAQPSAQADPLAQSEQLAQAEQVAEETQHAQTEPDRAVSKSKAANQPTSALVGARVVDPQDSAIGKVNDVVVTAEPPAVQVIVELKETSDRGTRLVAVPLPELTIRQDGSDEPSGQVDSVETSLTLAQLDALPPYQYQNRF